MVMKQLKRCLLFVFAVIIVASPAYSSITPPTMPTGANYVPKFDCPHPTPGWTKLDGFTWNSAETLSLLQYDVKLENNTAGQFKGAWDYQMNFGLEGALSLNKYVAFDGPGSCQHGAEIDVTLTITGGLAAGDTFGWINIFHEHGRSGDRVWTLDPPSGQTIPVVDGDGNIVDWHTSDDLPFYEDWNGNPHYNIWDRPSDLIDDADVPHVGGVSFMTLLTSWDGAYDAVNANVVNIYGGFEWGYTYQCTDVIIVVPAPGSISLAMFSIVIIKRLRLRNRMSA